MTRLLKSILFAWSAPRFKEGVLYIGAICFYCMAFFHMMGWNPDGWDAISLIYDVRCLLPVHYMYCVGEYYENNFK